MLKKMGYSLASIAFVGFVSAFAANNQQSPLRTDMKAFLVTVDAKGNEKLQAATKAEPGQIIQYQITSMNAGKKRLTGLAAVGPIPAHTHYVGKSATTKINARMQVSIDGGKTFEKEPVKRRKTMADGTVKTVIIPVEKYTHIRWEAKDALASGHKHAYSYRVKVD